MSRILNRILTRLLGTGASGLEGGGRALTREQRASQKRVRKAMRATRRMHRI